MAEVCIVELGVVATLLQQALVAAFFDDRTMVEHDDPVCRPHGGKAMGDQDAG